MIDYLNRCKEASQPCTIRSKSQLPASAQFECQGDNFPCTLCARQYAATDPKLLHVKDRHELVCAECRDGLKDSKEEMNITAERMLRRMMMRSISFPVPENVTFRNMIAPEWCEICLGRTTPIRCVQLPVANRCVMVCNLGCEVFNSRILSQILTRCQIGNRVSLLNVLRVSMIRQKFVRRIQVLSF